MNKEQEQIIDEVYKNYKRFTHNKNEKNGNYGDYSKWGDNPLIAGVQHLTKDSFIQMIKIDSEFSDEWGIKIEERELNHDERFVIYKKVSGRVLQPHITGINFKQFHFDESNIPTRLITLTYNNETIESYE